MRSLLLALSLTLLTAFARAEQLPPKAKHILFLGDSITYAGGYVDYFEAHYLTHHPEHGLDVLDLGLPSETVSGLSEEGHAGGKFPRPDLHERLDRVLAKVKPDLVFACYGMNDGIYLGFSEARFKKYQEGIQKLHDKVIAAGAQIIHLTPPVYDVEPIKAKASSDPEKPQYIGYEEVLAKYAAWLLDQRKQGWSVIDLHSPMKAALAERRAQKSDFFFAKDGVHADDAGHRVMATALLRGLGENPDLGALSPELIKLISQRRKIRCDAWLTACGHLRPGMAKGLPIGEAEAKANALAPAINAAAKSPAPQGQAK
jgi:lysophospholipase L1-like esterase